MTKILIKKEADKNLIGCYKYNPNEYFTDNSKIKPPKLLDPGTGRALKTPREKKKLYNLVYRLRQDGYIVSRRTKTVYIMPQQRRDTIRLKTIKTGFKFKLKRYPYRQLHLSL